MKLLVNKTTRAIHCASNVGGWRDLPDFLEVTTIAGDAETFAWPNGGASRCMFDEAGDVVADPAWQPQISLAQAIDAAIAGPVPTLAQLKTVLEVWRGEIR